MPSESGPGSGEARGLERIYEQAVSLPETERDAFLDEACGDDAELRAELASLLAEGQGAETFLDDLGRLVEPTGRGPPQPLVDALALRYRIERTVGVGGMATVYLADDLKHNRKVAIKVLKPELAAVVGSERFLAEIQTTASLQHPNILPLFDSGEADGRLFYVMPYVEGNSLRERLDREHQLPVDEAVRIATEVAEALEYAHAHGVIHRDIKPANILLQAGRPVVADFGIALALSRAGGRRLTETGFNLGTPHYMSPEQAAGDVSVGRGSDVYSLGCVLHEMLVGEPPYTGSTAQAVLTKVLQHEPVRVRESRPSVPHNVSEVVSRALAKIRADRFATAGEFARALADPAYSWYGQGGTVPRRTRSASTVWRRSTVGMSLMAVALAVGLGLFRYLTTGGGEEAGSARPGAAVMTDGASTAPLSIAVLPLKNRSRREYDEYFIGGFHEELLTQLSKIRSLDVRSLTSVLQYRGASPNLRTVAEELNARFIVEGSGQRQGDTIRLWFRLVGAGTDRTLWSRSFEEELTVSNLLNVQRQVALQVASALGAEVLPAERALLEPEVPENLRAYELYLEGLSYLRVITTAADFAAGHRNFNAAIESFERAIQEEPEWAPPHAALGIVYHWRRSITRGTSDFELSMKALEEALRLDSTHAPAWSALGFVNHMWRRDFEAAADAYERAEELGETNYHGQAILLLSLGRLDEAIETFDRAVEVDPRNDALRMNRAWALGCANEFERSIRELREHEEAIRGQSHGAATLRLSLARSYLRTGRPGEALSLMGLGGWSHGETAYILALADSTERARQILSSLRPDEEEFVDYAVAAALVLDDHPLAFDLMEQADPSPMWMLCFDEIRSLRGDPRLERILAPMGIPEPTGTAGRR